MEYHHVESLTVIEIALVHAIKSTLTLSVLPTCNFSLFLFQETSQRFVHAIGLYQKPGLGFRYRT